MLCLDEELDRRALAAMAAIAPEHWFTPVQFRNARSPSHPRAELAALDAVKAALVADWLASLVKDRSVLDLFSANGAFAIRCLQAGARRVVGVEASAGRVACARFLAGQVAGGAKLHFIEGDVFETVQGMSERFDVVLCFGGLYHLADPAMLLDRIRRVVTGSLLLQTSHVLRLPGSWARFVIRPPDEGGPDLPSVRVGRGTWLCSPGCLRALLQHAGFEVAEERGPLRPLRGRPRWYLARCVPPLS